MKGNILRNIVEKRQMYYYFRQDSYESKSLIICPHVMNKSRLKKVTFSLTDSQLNIKKCDFKPMVYKK